MEGYVHHHASCVALGGRGLMISGPSGCGKSTLALQLMAMGCKLVADDQVMLVCEKGQVMAHAPTNIQGMIEARHIGLLGAEYVSPVQVVCAVDLGHSGADRLPDFSYMTLLGVEVPLLQAMLHPYLAAGLLQYLRGGRVA